MAVSLKEKIKSNVLVNEDGCWLWQRPLNKNGYGQFHMGFKSQGNYISTTAHRISFLAFCGTIPPRYEVDHLCKVRSCVNPKHLEPVTPKENIRRSDGLPKQEARRTHCPAKHPYDEKNTYRRLLWNGSMARQCKQCDYDRKAAKRVASRVVMGVA